MSVLENLAPGAFCIRDKERSERTLSGSSSCSRACSSASSSWRARCRGASRAGHRALMAGPRPCWTNRRWAWLRSWCVPFSRPCAPSTRRASPCCWWRGTPARPKPASRGYVLARATWPGEHGRQPAGRRQRARSLSGRLTRPVLCQKRGAPAWCAGALWRYGLHRRRMLRGWETAACCGRFQLRAVSMPGWHRAVRQTVMRRCP